MLLLFVDVITVIFLLLLILKGYRRGLIVSILSLASLIAAYVSAYMFYKPAGQMIASRYDAPGYITGALGSAMVFFSVYIVCSLITKIVHWRMQVRAQKMESVKLTVLDKIFGTLLGAVTGITFIVLFIWCYNLANATQVGKILPDISDSIAARTSQAVIEKATYLLAGSSINDNDMARIFARSLSNPGQTVEDLQKLASNPQVKKLSKDSRFMNAMLAGDEEKLKHNASLDKMLDDPEVITNIQSLGLIAEGYDRKKMKETVASQLAKIGGELGKIGNDAEIKQILKDPALSKKFKDNNFENLLGDKKFRKLLNRAFEIVNKEKQ